MAGAIEEYEKARSLNDDPSMLGLLGNAYAAAGKRTEALKYLQRVMELAKRQYVSAANVATIHACLGEKEEARYL